MDILKTTYFGQYYFEVALILRESLFLSSVLLNSEAWTNLSNKNVRTLEQVDEMLLNKILECNAKTSNTMKYLELGIYPLRFEIMKRKLLFLQYILKQDKSSMLYKVFKVTKEKSIKNDFVQMCDEYLEKLKINLSFEEIESMSKRKFKKLVKKNVKKEAFKYLNDQKSTQSKTEKIGYQKLEIQDYLIDENCNTKLSKLIFKARTKMLDIKTQLKWKYDDNTCIECGENEETGDEILRCKSLQDANGRADGPEYEWFYSKYVKKIIEVGKMMGEGLKKRERLIEDGIKPCDQLKF